MQGFSGCVFLVVGSFLLLFVAISVTAGYKVDEISCADLVVLPSISSGLKCKSFEYPKADTGTAADENDVFMLPPNIILLSSIWNDAHNYTPFVPFVSHYDAKKMDVCSIHSKSISRKGDLVTGSIQSTKDSNLSKRNKIHRLVSKQDFFGISGEVATELTNVNANSRRYCGSVHYERDKFVPFFTLLFNPRGERAEYDAFRIVHFMLRLQESLTVSYESTSTFICEQLVSNLGNNLPELIPWSVDLLYYLMGGTDPIELEHNHMGVFSSSLDDEESSVINKRHEHCQTVKILAFSDINISSKEFTQALMAVKYPIEWAEVTTSDYYVILSTFFEDILFDNFEASVFLLKKILGGDDDAWKRDNDYKDVNFHQRIMRMINGFCSIEEKKYVVEKLMKTYRIQFDQKYSVALYAFKYFEADDNTDSVVEVAIVDEVVDKMGVNGLRGTFLNYGNGNGCINGVVNGCLGRLENANEILCERVGAYDEVIDSIASHFRSKKFLIQFCNIGESPLVSKFDIRNMSHYLILMEVNIVLLRNLSKKIYRSQLFPMKKIAANYVHRVLGLMEEESTGGSIDVDEDLIKFSAYYKRNYSTEEITDELHNLLLDNHIEDMIPTGLFPVGSEQLDVIGGILGLNSAIDGRDHCDISCARYVNLLRDGELLGSFADRSFRTRIITAAKKSKIKLQIPPELGVLRYLHIYRDGNNDFTTTWENVDDFILNSGKIFMWRTFLNPGCDMCTAYCAPLCGEGTLFLNSIWNDGKDIHDIFCSDNYAAKILEEISFIDESGKVTTPWGCDNNTYGKKVFDIFNFDDYLSLSRVNSKYLIYLARILFMSGLHDNRVNEGILKLAAQYMIDVPTIADDGSLEKQKALCELLIFQIASGKKINELIYDVNNWSLTEDEKRGLIALFPSIIEEYITHSRDNFFEYKAIFNFRQDMALEYLLEYKNMHFSEKLRISKQLPLEIINKMFISHTLNENEAGMLLIMLHGSEFGKPYLKAFVNVATRELLFATILSGLDVDGNECLNGKNSCFKIDWTTSNEHRYNYDTTYALEESLEDDMNQKSTEAKGIDIFLFLHRLKISGVSLKMVKLIAHTIIDDLDDNFDMSGFKQYFRFASPSLDDLMKRLNRENKNLVSAIAYWKLPSNDGRYNFANIYKDNVENPFGENSGESFRMCKDSFTTQNAGESLSSVDVTEFLLICGIDPLRAVAKMLEDTSVGTLMMLATRYLLKYPQHLDKFITEYERSSCNFDKLSFIEEPLSEQDQSFLGSPYVVQLQSVEPVEYKLCISTSEELIGRARMRYFFLDITSDKTEWMNTGSRIFDFRDFKTSTFKHKGVVKLKPKMASIPKVFVTLVVTEESVGCNETIFVSVGNILADEFTVYLEGDLGKNRCEHFSVYYMALVDSAEDIKDVRKRDEEKAINVRYRFEILLFDKSFREPENFKANTKEWLEAYKDENSDIEVDVLFFSYEGNKLFINGSLKSNIQSEDDNPMIKVDAIKDFLKKLFTKNTRCPADWSNNTELPNYFLSANGQSKIIFGELNNEFDMMCNDIIDSIESLSVDQKVLNLGPFILYNIPQIYGIHDITTLPTKREGPKFFTPIKLTVELEYPTSLLKDVSDEAKFKTKGNEFTDEDYEDKNIKKQKYEKEKVTKSTPKSKGNEIKKSEQKYTEEEVNISEPKSKDETITRSENKIQRDIVTRHKEESQNDEIRIPKEELKDEVITRNEQKKQQDEVKKAKPISMDGNIDKEKYEKVTAPTSTSKGNKVSTSKENKVSTSKENKVATSKENKFATSKQESKDEMITRNEKKIQGDIVARHTDESQNDEIRIPKEASKDEMITRNEQKKQQDEVVISKQHRISAEKASETVSSRKSSDGLSAGQIAGIVIGVIVFVVILSFILYYYFWFRKPRTDTISGV